MFSARPPADLTKQWRSAGASCCGPRGALLRGGTDRPQPPLRDAPAAGAGCPAGSRLRAPGPAGARGSRYWWAGRRKASASHCQVLIGLFFPIKTMPLSKRVAFMFSPTNIPAELLKRRNFQNQRHNRCPSVRFPLSATHATPQTAVSVIIPSADACLNS